MTALLLRIVEIRRAKDVYIRPRLAWDASSFLPLASRLGKGFLLCGDMNANHTAWGGKRCCTRGRAIAEVVLTCRSPDPQHRRSHLRPTRCAHGNRPQSHD
ncbi:hypothetical protein HPB49_000737 [Dermacentor silvarum]|uniref:Uncharacterized protein n=1 Tax=Dermacentor silvarum TaxID=543639 RepID=A0ACB8DS47_DERSI|nr:hypothetical protein HPB49_000737 [Dermacentor silvarum]